jgi:hypothetical protein
MLFIPPSRSAMRLLEVFDKPSLPDRYCFVFDEINQAGEYAVLAMAETGSSAVWVRELYEPGGTNEHLGNPVLLGALGDVALDGFFSWLGIVKECGREPR